SGRPDLRGRPPQRPIASGAGGLGRVAVPISIDRSERVPGSVRRAGVAPGIGGGASRTKPRRGSLPGSGASGQSTLPGRPGQLLRIVARTATAFSGAKRSDADSPEPTAGHCPALQGFGRRLERWRTTIRKSGVFLSPVGFRARFTNSPRRRKLAQQEENL